MDSTITRSWLQGWPALLAFAAYALCANLLILLVEILLPGEELIEGFVLWGVLLLFGPFLARLSLEAFFPGARPRAGPFCRVIETFADATTAVAVQGVLAQSEIYSRLVAIVKPTRGPDSVGLAVRRADAVSARKLLRSQAQSEKHG